MGCHSCKQRKLVNNENFLCYICLENYPEYMHYPCCHYGICKSCILTFKKEENIYRKKCPVCNQKSSIKKIISKEMKIILENQFLIIAFM
jgi:Zn finger protein HypA/HybF involved in hydrogenase expression